MTNQDELKKLCYMRAMDIYFSSSKDELVDNLAQTLQDFYNYGYSSGEDFKNKVIELLKENE